MPRGVLGWPTEFLQAFLDGFVVGDGSIEDTRISLWTSSDGLAGDLLVLLTRLGLRAGSTYRTRGISGLHQIYTPYREHKLLTSVPLPDELLRGVRERVGLWQFEASLRMGYASGSGLNNIEQGVDRDAVRLATLRKLREVYADAGASRQDLQHLDRLIDGGLSWDVVVEVRETESIEPIYDIEVRPGGRKIENFVAGVGGVLVANTAGFVDAGFEGHLTLELSNVANLPIVLYPGMKIGQLAFFQLDRPAENPYGSTEVGSKYKGQEGPTASKYFLNFDEAVDED